VAGRVDSSSAATTPSIQDEQRRKALEAQAAPSWRYATPASCSCRGARRSRAAFTGSRARAGAEGRRSAENFAAEMERAYIDGHQARFLFASPTELASLSRQAGHRLSQRTLSDRQLAGSTAGSPTTIQSSGRGGTRAHDAIGDVMPQIRSAWP